MKTQLSILTVVLLLTSCAPKKAHNSTANPTEQILELTQNHIYDLKLLKTPQWKKFVSYLNSKEMKTLKGKAYEIAFNKAAEKLPFSHFYIDYKNPNSKSENKNDEKPPFELEEINSSIVLLHLREFASNAKAMTTIVEDIALKKYKHLIIDLRENSGGSLDAAVVLGRYLTNKSMDAGIYVTRKWYNNHSNPPSKKDIENFAYLKDLTYEGFMEMQKENAFRMVLPGHSNPIFKGNTYILTSNYTASACEPFVHILKTQGIATLIGENTAGKMLSANWFKVNEEVSVFIPTNDYITSEGYRLDQVGVAPHINVPSKNALEKALKIIQKTN